MTKKQIVRVNLRTSGSAFEGGPEYEAARLLRKVAAELEEGRHNTGRSIDLRDANGQVCGQILCDY